MPHVGIQSSHNPGPINHNIVRRRTNNSTSPPVSDHSVFKAKAVARHKSNTAAYIAAMNDGGIIDRYINLTEDERTAIKKKKDRIAKHSDKAAVRRTIWEKGRGLGSTVATASRRLCKQIKEGSRKRVRFAAKVDTQEYD